MSTLEIGGVRVDTLAKEYGTPLYIYNEGKIKQKLADFKTYFRSDVFKTDVLYASKAFSVVAMYKLVKEYHCGIDVVSGGELYTAKAADFPMENVYFHGNNKSLDELRMAIDYKVGTIVVDNLMEAEVLVELMKDAKYQIHTLVRVNPGIDAHTHKYIVTANIDSKFGISIQYSEKIAELIKTLQSSSNIIFDGFHAHIGSQIFDKNAFVTEIETLFAFGKKLKDEYNISINTIDLGGGFAAFYTKEDAPIPLPAVCSTIIQTCEREEHHYELGVKHILIEPGRSIVGEAGYTLYSVGFMKETANKNYIFIDGGMSDNIRPALYGAAYDADIANRMDEKKVKHYKIAGKCCESGDIIIEDVVLPEHVERGDLLVTYTTGAYGYSMASHYNKNLMPAVVFVENGTTRVVVERETYNDLLRKEVK